MGEITFFELLAVTPLSTDSEVHTAFFELGRLVHPSHTKRLGLEGKEGAFRLLFERATEAYLTLSDSERKLAYLREVGPAGQQVAEGQSHEKRDQEKQEVARTAYERALALIERQDFYGAIQLLEQAVRVNPQAEYLTLLADCQAENPQWLDRAIFNYQKALRARPADPSIQARLGYAHERRGEYLAARSAYEAALEVAPEMQSAQAGLLRLGGNPDQEHKAGGLADRLRRFFGVGRGSD